MFLVSKIIQLTLALLMLIFSVIRIGFMEDFDTITGFMISFYLIMFAIIFICVETNCKKSRMWFYFLNGTLGKALFHLFLFFLCNGNGAEPTWVDILLSVIFFITSVVFFVMHCLFRDQESLYIQSLISPVLN